MTDEPRYLPVCCEDGSWIGRPDLFLLSFMAFSDNEDLDDAVSVFEHLVQADSTREKLSPHEERFRDTELSRNMKYRIYAGHVMFELLRMKVLDHGKPTFNRACQIAGHSQFWLQEPPRRGSPTTSVSEMKKAFAAFRSTSHLQAAAVVAQQDIMEIEGSLSNLKRFLANARAFEMLVDYLPRHPSTPWSPWRVPTWIAATPLESFRVPAYDARELEVLGGK